jgi:hypothetical protein
MVQTLRISPKITPSRYPMNLLDDFLDRASILKDASFEDTTGRLFDLLAWLEQEPRTKLLLQELRQKVNVNPLFASGEGHRPRSHTREEIAAVGLHLIEICRARDLEFYDVCLNYDIAPRHGSGNYQDYNDAGLQDFIFPFLRHVEKALLQAAAAFSVAAVAENRFGQILTGDVKELFPVTSDHLRRISTEFLRPDAEVSWQNVGNSCRQTLIDFAAEFRTASDIELPADTAKGDVKGILRLVLQKISSPSRHRDTLETLADSLWNHTQTVLHRSATTKAEATRIYLWTGMLVSEFAQLLRAYNEA